DAVATQWEPVLDRVGRGRVAKRALPLATLPTEPEFEILLGVVDAEGVQLASTATSICGSPRPRQHGSLRRFARAPAALRHQAVRIRPIHVKLVRAEDLAATTTPLLRGGCPDLGVGHRFEPSAPDSVAKIPPDTRARSALPVAAPRPTF